MVGPSAEGARLVNTLLFGSLGEGTNAAYTRMWRTWGAERAKGGQSQWLREEDGVDSAVKELSVFIASRCFVHKNQSTTIRGYLSAIKYFHKIQAGWELPTTHFQIRRGDENHRPSPRRDADKTTLAETTHVGDARGGTGGGGGDGEHRATDLEGVGLVLPLALQSL